jgi:hypothetical protein
MNGSNPSTAHNELLVIESLLNDAAQVPLRKRHIRRNRWMNVCQFT